MLPPRTPSARKPRQRPPKPVMPGSLFPRSPTPASPPELREKSTTTPRHAAPESRRKRRERVISAPDPPEDPQHPVLREADPQPGPSSPRQSSPAVSVKIERSPSVEFIPPPPHLTHRRGDGRPLPPRTPRNRNTTRSSRQHSPPSSPDDLSYSTRDYARERTQSPPPSPVSKSSGRSALPPPTPNASLKRIQSLEEEVQRLRMQVTSFIPSSGYSSIHIWSRSARTEL